MKTALFQEELPSMAHVHVGHALTHWKTTPDKKGLLLVAEDEARIALEEAEKVLQGLNDLEFVKQQTRNVMHAVDPKAQKKGPGLGFGLKRAAVEATSHITFAAESEDASSNVQAFADEFEKNMAAVVSRCDLIIALGEEILQSDSAAEAGALSEEVVILSRANVNGLDMDDDGAIGSITDEYGLDQLKSDLVAMTEREDPPYQPVPRVYLLGAVRLPDGKWTYSWLADSSQHKGYRYDYSGGDGGDGGGDGGGGGY